IVLGERDDGGSGAIALAVLDHARLAAFHDRDARVGRAEVDADDFAHGPGSPAKFPLIWCLVCKSVRLGPKLAKPVILLRYLRTRVVDYKGVTEPWPRSRAPD